MVLYLYDYDSNSKDIQEYHLLPIVPGKLKAAGPGEVNSAEIGPLLLCGT